MDGTALLDASETRIRLLDRIVIDDVECIVVGIHRHPDHIAITTRPVTDAD